MTFVDEETPDAQVDEENLEADAGEQESPPPSTEEPTPPSAAPEGDTIKELRDRLAQSGRHIAQLTNANTVLATQINATNERLNQLGATLTAEQKAKQDAYLHSLPPDQREKEELRLNNQRLETRLSALERERTAPREPTEQEQQQATVRYAQQMADEAAVEFGLEDTERINAMDPRLQAAGAWESPDHFKRQVRILARKIANGKEPAQAEGASAVADNKSKDKGKAAPTAANADVDIDKRIKAAVNEALGGIGGAPNSPRPAAVVPERTPDEQAYQNTLRGYSPTAGPQATRKALKAQLAQAEAALAKKR